MKTPPGTQRERFAAWLEGRRRSRKPHEEAELLQVADAYDDAMQSQELTKDRLDRIVAGASSPKALVWCNSTDLLGKLSSKWPAAASAIEGMSFHRKAHVRFAALCSLTKGTPVEITDRILKALLPDRSSRVRWKAGEIADRLARVNLVPDIAAVLAVEQHERTRRSLELSLRMLRDGVWVRPDGRGRSRIAVKIEYAYVFKTVNDKQLRSKGLTRILDELRKSHVRLPRDESE